MKDFINSDSYILIFTLIIMFSLVILLASFLITNLKNENIIEDCKRERFIYVEDSIYKCNKIKD